MKKPKTTVFTPIHLIDLEIISKTIESLENQIDKDFRWIVVLNGKAANKIINNKLLELLEPLAKIIYSKDIGIIGALKGLACLTAIEDGAELLVELDWDDLLEPTAIEELRNTETPYVYSNGAQFMYDGDNILSPIYGTEFGWKTRKYSSQIGELNELISFPPTPQYSARIEWAPNHVRAYRSDAYTAVGGYSELAGGDDHELMCRFYLNYGEKGFTHIDKCLYLYRLHPNNTVRNQELLNGIQKQVDKNYCSFAEKMFLRWAGDNQLAAYDLGGRFGSPGGYQTVDLLDADITMDLSKPWDIADNSVGVLRAYHLIEHLPDTILFFNEAYRVLAPGGLLLIEVPSTNGPLAFADPTHIKFFNLDSFEYYTNRQKAQFIRPQCVARFQKRRVLEYNWEPGKPVVSAQMLALKGWYDERWAGEKNV